MRWLHFLLAAILLFLSCGLGTWPGKAAASATPRLLFITLIPDYKNNQIRFDAQMIPASPSAQPDLSGLPLKEDQAWQDPNTYIWTIRGTIPEGVIQVDRGRNLYHLLIGPIFLQPQDDLKWIFPFVNLDYAQIRPVPDLADKDDLESRERTHRFTYRGGENGREIQILKIPFRLIPKQIDLTLTPLMGEVLIDGKHRFWLSGKVIFHSISDFNEFSLHCQSTASQILHGDDYRSGVLLHALDYPHYFGPDVMSSTYQSKPTSLELRSALRTCQYDLADKQGEVEAVFFGRSSSIDPDPSLFPVDWKESDVKDGNFSFSPDRRYTGLRGYELQLGEILLAPGDTLTLTLPNTSIQVDSLSPVPDQFNHLNGQTRIVYMGPAAFKLSLPYVAQSELYVSQFPAIFRPAFSVLEEELKPFFPWESPWLTLIVFGLGILLLLISGFMLHRKWLAMVAWLFIAVGFYYGMRGSFGLLGLAVALYLSRSAWNSSASKDRRAAQQIALALVGVLLIAAGAYLDRLGNAIFQGLSEPDLSPLTPIVLLLVVSAVAFLLYGAFRDTKRFQSSALPTLALLLSVLALYDALDKSLIALSVLLGGLVYVMKRANHPGNVEEPNGDQFELNLLDRFDLAFKNRVVPIALIILVIFAFVNDLAGAYANQMEISIAPLLTPITIPLLVFVSVFVAFTSIALLFLVVYPVLPSQLGYSKALYFSGFLFLVFLFGIGTDDRLIASLPNILAGRMIFYLSVPLFIGLYLDITDFMQKENQRISKEGGEKKSLSFKDASGIYLKNLQSVLGTLLGIASLVIPSLYAFTASQPVLVTYFDLLEKLVLLPL